jgi:hypothetical protein
MLQREHFKRLKAQDPELSEEAALATTLYHRYVTAWMQGDDLFGLNAFKLQDPNEPPPAMIAAVVEIIRSRRIHTIDELADAIVGEEAKHPGNIPPAPSVAHAAEQVTRILAETRRRVSAPS